VSGEMGHMTNDGWVIDKHQYVADANGRCTECGQPESNAGHPPLPHEAPIYPSLDEQMAEAVGGMQRVRTAVMLKPREGWTREQWLAEADEIMNDINGSAASLLNGHITAMQEEIAELRRRNLSARALRVVDLRIIMRVTPVVNAAQEWNFSRTPESITTLEKTVRAYNAIVSAEASAEAGEKDD
jgi:hypothetical protein